MGRETRSTGIYQGNDMGNKDGAAFQIIVLGGGGGPSEADTTGLLVRSTSTRWTKGSIIAVDAGVHLSAIEEIVRQHLPNAVRAAAPTRSSGRLLPPVPTMSPRSSRDASVKDKNQLKFFSPIAEARGSRAPSPSKESAKKNYVLKSGPFSDLMVPYESPASIASYMFRNLISTIIITHPHLDHLSGFTINTAALGGSRKKIIAGLPETIEAIKTHIFNDVIWPNMSDEDGGIGFISYNRLVEGGHPVFGDGDSSGYSEICDGLEIKGRTVSHGHCMKQHKHRGSGSLEPASPTTIRRRSSRMGSWSAAPPGTSHGGASQLGFLGNNGPDMQHFHPQTTPSTLDRCVIDSSAFFIRDEETGKEILVFGDVEPDQISEDPRNDLVWSDAAPKIARGALQAVFIECSYDDSQPDGMLFGHLAPRWLVYELARLADKVLAYTAGTPAHELQTLVTAATPNSLVAAHVPMPSSIQTSENGTGTIARKKRRINKDQNGNGNGNGSSDSTTYNHNDSPSRRKSALPHLNLRASVSAANPARPHAYRAASGISPMSSPALPHEHFLGADGLVSSTLAGTDADVDGLVQSSIEGTEADGSTAKDGGSSIAEREREDGTDQRRPLEGLKVVIIHVKDPLRDDHDARELILRQCLEHEARENLGCEFYTCRRGDSVWV